MLGLIAVGASSPAAAQSSPDSTDWVQVRLHHGTEVESVRLTPRRSSLSVLLPSSDSPIIRLNRDETVTLGRRQGDVYARRGTANLYAR